MRIKIRYFGVSREVSVKEEDVQLDGSDYATLRAILLKEYHPLTYTPFLCLKEGTPMFPETELKDGDEISLVAQIGSG